MYARFMSKMIFQTKKVKECERPFSKMLLIFKIFKIFKIKGRKEPRRKGFHRMFLENLRFESWKMGQLMGKLKHEDKLVEICK